MMPKMSFDVSIRLTRIVNFNWKGVIVVIEPKLKALVQVLVDSADERNGDRICIDADALARLIGYVAPATQEDYVADMGQNCPFCGTTSIEFDDLWCLSGSVVTQECICNDCDATWDEEYTLSGYTPIRPG